MVLPMVVWPAAAGSIHAMPDVESWKYTCLPDVESWKYTCLPDVERDSTRSLFHVRSKF